MRIGLLQLNATIGAFDKNRTRLEAAYREAVEKGAELVLAPELFLCGYPPRDLLLRDDFIQRGLDCLQALTRAVGPRPIGWISTRAKDGTRNLAPYSFFNAFNYVPPIIGFSTIGWKDTIANIEATGEFVWNLATRKLADAMNATCASVGPEVDEFALAGVTPAPSRLVAPDRVLESPVNFECRLTQLIQLQAADGRKVSSWLALGEVVAVHIDPSLIVDGVYQTAAAGPILRAGRMGDYFEIKQDAMFEMARPR